MKQSHVLPAQPFNKLTSEFQYLFNLLNRESQATRHARTILVYSKGILRLGLRATAGSDAPG